MKPCPKKTVYEWEDTEHTAKWICQSTVAGGERHTEDWIGTVAVDGSSRGAPGKYPASGYGIAQLSFDHEGEPEVWRVAQYLQHA